MLEVHTKDSCADAGASLSLQKHCDCNFSFKLATEDNLHIPMPALLLLLGSELATQHCRDSPVILLVLTIPQYRTKYQAKIGILHS